MTKIRCIQKKIKEIELSELVMPLVKVARSQSLESPYISPEHLTDQAIQTLLITQPIIVVDRSDQCQCICGIRTLHAVKTNFNPSNLVPVHMIENSSISDETIIQLASTDLYLKTFIGMFLREPNLLSELYAVVGKDHIKAIAPGHQSKAQFAKDAGYSRQRIFYEK